MTALPHHKSKQGVLDVRKIAKDIGCSAECIYKWLRSNRITLDGARKLIALSRKKLGPSDFIEFLFAD